MRRPLRARSNEPRAHIIGSVRPHSYPTSDILPAYPNAQLGNGTRTPRFFVERVPNGWMDALLACLLERSSDD